jgi:hypothetical protein
MVVLTRIRATASDDRGLGTDPFSEVGVIERRSAPRWCNRAAG